MSDPSSGNVLAVLGINGKMFVAQAVNIALIGFVVWRWLYRPVIRILRERSEKIAHGISQAEAAQKRLDDVNQKTREILEEARQEAKSILAHSRDQIETLRKESLARTEREIEGKVLRVQEAIAQEKEQMLFDAKKHMAELVAESLEVAATKAIDASGHRCLVKESVQNLYGA